MLVIGIILILISLFILWLSMGFQKRNNEIKKNLKTETGIPIQLNKENFGNPGGGIIFGLIGIVVGLLLIVAGS